VSLLGARALGLAVDGFRVIPLKPNGKIPQTDHGCMDASDCADMIGGWWHRWPDANVGVATGHAFFVVDIDVKNGVDGEATWRALQQHREAPKTRAVRTPSGGRHLYFSTAGASVSNSVNRLGRGLDIRGTGGYVVAAGVIDGRGYETMPAPIAPPPPWLLDRLRDLNTQRRSVAEWRQLVCDGVGRGQRNDTVAALAGHLLRQRVNTSVALELLRAWNKTHVTPPLCDAELVRCFASIERRELRRREGLRS
jgi:hypothetical protein